MQRKQKNLIKPRTSYYYVEGFIAGLNLTHVNVNDP